MIKVPRYYWGEIKRIKALADSVLIMAEQDGIELGWNDCLDLIFTREIAKLRAEIKELNANIGGLSSIKPAVPLTSRNVQEVDSEINGSDILRDEVKFD